MPTASPLHSKARKAKQYLRYSVGLLLIINGIGLFTYSIASGFLMTIAGLLLFPKVQTALEEKANTSFNPLMMAGIIGILYLSSSALLLVAVDITQAPDFIVPFK